MNRRLKFASLISRFNRSLTGFLFLTFFVLLFLPLGLRAAHWSWSVKGGFGGTGIKKAATIEDNELETSRSEGPGMIGVGAEMALSDQWTLGVEHRRGFRLGPFSAGVGFTDATWRWYFSGSVPALVSKDFSEYIFQKKWAFFVGPAVGIAFGTITREADLVSDVKSSGVVFGIKAGADYHMQRHFILRPELIASSTLMDSGNVPSSMSEFGLMIGFVFPY